MRQMRLARLLSVALAAALLTGCSADDDAAEGATSAPEAGQAAGEAAQPTSPTDGLPDRDICTAFSDVMTIVENADLGVRDGRMEAQEQRGWYALATRVLHRLPSSGDGPVSQAVADLQEIAPAVALASGTEPVGIGSDEWHAARVALADACRDVGVELAIGVFTGG